MRRARFSTGLGSSMLLLAVACSSSSGPSGSPDGGGGGVDAPSGTDAHGGVDARGGSPDGGGGKPDTGGPTDGGGTKDSAGPGGDGGIPAGWLYTKGAAIYESDGKGSGKPWMGRGVNLDDIFLCGYNYQLQTSGAEGDLETIVSGLMSAWKPTFVRVSLGMDGGGGATTVSWLSNFAQYKTPMTNVIQAIGKNPGVYALVTLRNDASMTGLDDDSTATDLPSDSTTTPDKTTFPMGTDPVYVSLVDTFANDAFVLFGLSNEPGGNTLSEATLSAAMSHAVGVIRAEEDRLKVPHHLVSVQGNVWTSDISFYSTTPLTYDNVVYEVHGYPPPASSYTYSNIPVIIGEYGSFTSGETSADFYADVEKKQIPNLAWDFEPYSDCAPDLLNVTDDAKTLTPTAWGTTVQTYLAAH